MYIEDIISKLNKRVVRFHNVDYYPAITVQDILRDKAKQCISWSVDDFEEQAKQNSDPDTWEQYYNKDYFQSALEEMVNNYDSTIGITWDTVDNYLEMYCKIKDYVESLEMKNNKKKDNQYITTHDLSAIDDMEEHIKRNR